MDLETQIGWVIIYILTSGMIFYSLGFRSGKAEGYLKGRAAGMRIGRDRVNNG
jgi:hypothetical protein